MAQARSGFQVRCHLCDQAVTIPPLSHLQTAHCPRCGDALTRFHRHGVDYALAFACSAAVFLCASIPFRFLSFSSSGQEESIQLPETVTRLLEENYLVLAVVQLVTIFLIPALILLAVIYLLIPLRLGRPAAPASEAIYLGLQRIIPWGMAEVFLIGTLVSGIKLSSLADIELGNSFYAFVLFSICLVATLYYFDHQQIRHHLNLHESHHRGHRLSIQHTWALLITATLLYIPASSLPIMTTRIIGDDSASTIMGGVIQLWEHQSYPVAIIIFVASVFVPIAKIMLLGWLNYTVHARILWQPDNRLRIYRLTEFIGRWSMIDVFVVALLVSLIHLGNFFSIYPGPAAVAFCGVVILTMLAAITFDSHLIWDPCKND